MTVIPHNLGFTQYCEQLNVCRLDRAVVVSQTHTHRQTHLVGWRRLSGQTRPLGLVQQGQIISALRRQTVPHWADPKRHNRPSKCTPMRPLKDSVLFTGRPLWSPLCLVSVYVEKQTPRQPTLSIFTHKKDVLKSRNPGKRSLPGWFNPRGCARYAWHIICSYYGLYRAIFLGKTFWRLHISFHCLQTLGPEVSWSVDCG